MRSVVLRVLTALLTATVAVLAVDTSSAEPDIAAIVDRVDQQRVRDHIDAIDEPRNAFAQPVELQATVEYLQAQLESFGYPVTLDPVTTVRPGGEEATFPNVLGVHQGTVCPERVFVVGAHYDTVPPWSVVPGSPGADDNASGVAGMLEIARALADTPLPATIWFTGLTMEEEGLVGGRHMAQQARDARTRIVGMLSLEGIGYTTLEPNGDFVAVIGNERSAPLVDSFVRVNEAYVPELRGVAFTVEGNGEFNPDTRRSDHAPFWDAGYQALLVSDTAGFRNPNYHQTTDTLDTLDLTFATNVTKAMLAMTVDYLTQDGDSDGWPDVCTPISSHDMQGTAAVDAGGSHTCALTAAGGVQCWGKNVSGQLGDGQACGSDFCRHPVEAAGLGSGVVAVAAGGSHTCALTASGGVKCWGSGHGTSTPSDVAGLENGVAAISAGNSHTCAVTIEGSVKCWGANSSGQLGDGRSCGVICAVPVDVAGLSSGVADVAAGNTHTCAVTIEGGVKCWGSNADGELGDGTSGFGNLRTTPVETVGLSSGVAAIAAGLHYTCAVTVEGGVKCWGRNDSSQLGDGTGGTVGDHSAIPLDVVGLTSGAAAVSTGHDHTCALTTVGGVKCWGMNDFGQVGDGTTANRATPVDVSGLATGAAAVTAGGVAGLDVGHTCALATAGGVKCWGFNSFGQLGDGLVFEALAPVDVVDPAGDDDRDGCSNQQELGPLEALGGRRDPDSFWDFFDVYTGNPRSRDQAIIAADIAAQVLRFGATGDPGGDPFVAPSDLTGYHTAFDRGGTVAGLNVWNLLAPDGAIIAGDIASLVLQFGHVCAQE